jgi:methylmalonyl-CoA mutase N-terminal domain/subunit
MPPAPQSAGDPRLAEFLKRHGGGTPRTTPSGIPLEPVYSDSALIDLQGLPGEYPFTRGIHPTMYRERLWTMRQYAGFGTAAETNARFRMLLAAGQTGLSIAFDLPTQMGYDPDHELAGPEVGKVGVSIASIEDFLELFAGIPLDRVSTSMTINATAIILLALYVEVGRRQGVPARELRGTIQNDILKEYAARGTYRFPPRPSLRLITDVFAYGREHLPSFNLISISGYHIREAGATAVQEVAFTLANGIAYVEAARRAGIDVDGLASRLSFFFNAHNHLLEEVAKFRAARKLWARIMKERFGARDPRSWLLRFHAQTAGSTLTSQQPEINAVRVTVQALAAVLGGAQSLHTNSRDEALSLPSEDSARLALRTQQILARESGVADVVDPLGGSVCVEHLTEEIVARAEALIAAIDQEGGAVAAIERGTYQREIQRSAWAHQQAVEAGRVLIVGVNEHVVKEPEPVGLFRPDEARARARSEEVAERKARRPSLAVQEALARVHAAASGNRNLFPPVLDAVAAGVTVGEISTVLEGVWGRYRESPVP